MGDVFEGSYEWHEIPKMVLWEAIVWGTDSALQKRLCMNENLANEVQDFTPMNPLD